MHVSLYILASDVWNIENKNKIVEYIHVYENAYWKIPKV